MRVCGLLVLALACGCTQVSSRFECRQDAQCRTGSEQGVCERTGFCSFDAPSCATGRAYRRGAGPLSGQCVGCIRDLDAGGRSGSGVSQGFACAVRRNGTVWCWGDGRHGQLGEASDGVEATPVRVAELDDATAVTAGGFHACALHADGSVSCWGENEHGQLGRPPSAPQLAPAAVEGLPEAVAVAAGDSHTCALGRDARVYCWGNNSYGNLGDGTETTRSTPEPVMDLEGMVEVTAGYLRTCARERSGSLWCWGWSAWGQLGDGTVGQNKASPVRVEGVADGATVRAGTSHGCVLHRDGGASCWGRNNRGQLGDASYENRLGPVPVEANAPFRDLAAGGSHTCGIDEDRQVWCWGSGDSGQLGDGTAEQDHDRDVPAVVAELDDAVQLALGVHQSCVLRTDASMWCWGGGEHGELGHGARADSATPVRVDLTCPAD